MELQKGFPSLKRPNQEVIEFLDHCCLCGTKLKYQHQTDFFQLIVKEKAECPSCGIATKMNNFRLQ